jgi:hypothetical protein
LQNRELDLTEIARLHGRTEGSIKSRCVIYALKSVNDGQFNHEEAAEYYRTNTADIQQYNDRENARSYKQKVNKLTREIAKGIMTEEGASDEHNIPIEELKAASLLVKKKKGDTTNVVVQSSKKEDQMDTIINLLVDIKALLSD